MSHLYWVSILDQVSPDGVQIFIPDDANRREEIEMTPRPLKNRDDISKDRVPGLHGPRNIPSLAFLPKQTALSDSCSSLNSNKLYNSNSNTPSQLSTDETIFTYPDINSDRRAIRDSGANGPHGLPPSGRKVHQQCLNKSDQTNSSPVISDLRTIQPTPDSPITENFSEVGHNLDSNKLDEERVIGETHPTGGSWKKKKDGRRDSTETAQINTGEISRTKDEGKSKNKPRLAPQATIVDETLPAPKIKSDGCEPGDSQTLDDNQILSFKSDDCI